MPNFPPASSLQVAIEGLQPIITNTTTIITAIFTPLRKVFIAFKTNIHFFKKCSSHNCNLHVFKKSLHFFKKGTHFLKTNSFFYIEGAGAGRDADPAMQGLQPERRWPRRGTGG